MEMKEKLREENFEQPVVGCILVQDGHLTPIQIQTLEKYDKKDGQLKKGKH